MSTDPSTLTQLAMEAVGKTVRMFVPSARMFVPYSDFDVDDYQDYFQHLWHVSIYIAAVYLVFVYSAQRFIQVSREMMRHTDTVQTG